MSLTPYSFTLSVACPVDPQINVTLDGYTGPGTNQITVRAIASRAIPSGITISVTSWDYQLNDDGIWYNMTDVLTINAGETFGSYSTFTISASVLDLVEFRIITGSPTTSGIWTINYA